MDFYTGHRVVVDTNSFMTDPNLIGRFHNSEIVISGTVLTELNNHKEDENGAVAHASRQVVNMMKQLVGLGDIAKGVTVGDNNVVRFNPHADLSLLPNTFDPAVFDQKILATALGEEIDSPKPVAIMTADNLMILHAAAMGIPCFGLPPRQMPKVLPSMQEIALSEKELSTLVRAGELYFEDADAFHNKFYLIHSVEKPTAKPVLARFVTDQVLPERSTDFDDVRKQMFSVHHGRLIPLPTAYPGNFQPRNVEQRMAYELLFDFDTRIVWLEGKAGTGKTLMALYAALEQSYFDSRNRLYNRVMLSRATLAMGGEQHGFLKGDLTEKTDRFFEPYYLNLTELQGILGDGRIQLNPPLPGKNQRRRIQQSGDEANMQAFLRNPRNIYTPSTDITVTNEILSFTRGTTLKNTLWIVDEAQNLTPQQIETILTRLGEGSKVILMADPSPSQIDPPLTAATSGFRPVMEAYRGNIISGHVKFVTSERSITSEITSEMIDIRRERDRQMGRGQNRQPKKR